MDTLKFTTLTLLIPVGWILSEAAAAYPEPLQQIDMAGETIGTSLNELRSLSKLINPDTLTNLSLVEALKLEIERFNRMKYLDATLLCSMR